MMKRSVKSVETGVHRTDLVTIRLPVPQTADLQLAEDNIRFHHSF